MTISCHFSFPSDDKFRARRGEGAGTISRISRTDRRRWRGAAPSKPRCNSIVPQVHRCRTAQLPRTGPAHRARSYGSRRQKPCSEEDDTQRNCAVHAQSSPIPPALVRAGAQVTGRNFVPVCTRVTRSRVVFGWSSGGEVRAEREKCRESSCGLLLLYPSANCQSRSANDKSSECYGTRLHVCAAPGPYASRILALEVIGGNAEKCARVFALLQSTASLRAKIDGCRRDTATPP